MALDFSLLNGGHPDILKRIKEIVEKNLNDVSPDIDKIG